MKSSILLSSLFACLTIAASSAFAVDITFTSSGIIQEGDVYDAVYVSNDGTVVDMTGGEIDGIIAYDKSIFNLLEGRVLKGISLEEGSSINISGGTCSGIPFLRSGSYLTISGGICSFGNYMKSYSGSTMEISGGIVDFAVLNSPDNVTIRGGVLNVQDMNSLGANNITIYGYDFNYVPNTNEDIYYNSNGLLTGFLSDGNTFSIGGLMDSEYNEFHLVNIPEPVSLFLFALGGLLLKRTRCSV